MEATMLGINVVLWTINPTSEDRPLFELVQSIGYRVVEVPLLNSEATTCRDLARVLDELGLARTAVTVRGESDNPVSPDPIIRRLGIDHNKHAVDCAAALGATVIGGPFYAALGHFTGTGPTHEEWRWAVEGMQEVAEYAAARRIALSVEFLHRFEIHLLNTTAAAAQFVKDVGEPNVGIHYDTFHAHIEEANIRDAIHQYGSLINHVHLSENHRGIPGQGLVRWDETFAAFRDIGYEGHFVVEAFGQGIPELIAPCHLWRATFDSEEQLARDAFSFLAPSVTPLPAAA
jgi:D-psicose/D-tagatose/L-ribulose 3-epimerase